MKGIMKYKPTPPKRTKFYDEPSSFLLNAEIRTDIELLKQAYRINSTGALIRFLIQSAKKELRSRTA